jgi:hypothetical protein
MMKKINWNKTFPYFIAIVLFTVLSFTYFSPVIEGKVIMGHDTQNYLAMSKECTDYSEQQDVHQYWTNSMFGGMPTYQIQAHQENNMLQYVNNLQNAFPRPVSFSILYLFCAFLLLLTFRVNPWLSMVGAILFAFASYNFIIIAAGHNTKAITIAYMMPLIGSVVLAFRGKRLLGGLLTALFLGLAIYANHLQILYYALFVLIIFFIVEAIYAIKEKQIPSFLKTSGVLLIAAFIGIGTNASMLLTTYEYSKDTMRGDSNNLTIDKQSSQRGLNSDYITSWSYGVPETMTLLIPNFRGGASGGYLTEDSHTGKKLKELGAPDVEKMMAESAFPTYWGDQPFTSGPVYVGAIVCFLFVLGLFLVEDRYKWWLLAVTILSILLSWGKNFMPLTDFFINHVPMYNKFRTVSMTLVMAGVAMPLLGILALKNLFDGSVKKEKAFNALKYSTIIVGGICLLFSIMPSLAGNFTSPGDAQFSGQYEFLKTTLPLDRKDMLQSDAFRSLIFTLLTAGVLYFVIKDKLKTTYAIMALGLLFIFDLYPVAKRYLNENNFTESEITLNPYKPSEADKFILQDKSLDYRVINLTIDPFNDASPSYFHKNIGGYHAAKLRRYQELINIHLGKQLSDLITTLRQVKTEDEVAVQLKKSSVLNMLNMKYMIINPNGRPFINPFANGNAWLVEKIHIAQNANEEMTVLGTIDTKKELVADKLFTKDIVSGVADSSAHITLTSYKPMELKYHFSSKTNQVAVFSEIYYDKGWNAYINGQKVPYFRADYLLRAMSLTAGDYDIEFRFEPTSVSVGDSLALISSLLILGLLGFVIWDAWSKQKNGKKSSTEKK